MMEIRFKIIDLSLHHKSNFSFIIFANWQVTFSLCRAYCTILMNRLKLGMHGVILDSQNIATVRRNSILQLLSQRQFLIWARHRYQWRILDFPDGKTPISDVGLPVCYFGKKIPKNCMKMNWIWTVGGGGGTRPWRPICVRSDWSVWNGPVCSLRISFLKDKAARKTYGRQRKKMEISWFHFQAANFKCQSFLHTFICIGSKDSKGESNTIIRLNFNQKMIQIPRITIANNHLTYIRYFEFENVHVSLSLVNSDITIWHCWAR